MNIFAISGLLIAILSAVMAFLMFLRGRNFLHYLWGIFCLSVMVWGIGAFRVATAANPAWSIFWWKVGYIGVIFIPILFTHFTCKFLNRRSGLFIWLIYLLGFFFLALNLITDLFINQVRWTFNEFYYLQPSIFYNLFVALFIGLVIYSHVLLLFAYKASRGIKKNQIKYFFIGTSIGFFGGSFSFLPVYHLDLYPTLNLLVSLYPPIVAYAILHYRLMDIRVAARSIFIYAGIAAFSYGIFYFLTGFYNYAFGSVYSSGAYIASLIIAPLFVLGFYGIDKLITNFSNKYLFAGLYNYQATINKLSQELNYLNDLDQIINLIVDSIKQTMQLDRAGVLLIDPQSKPIHYQIAKVIGFNEQNGISLVQDNFLTKYLEKNQKPLVRDELALIARDVEDPKEKTGFEKLNSHMKQIEASLCLPLLSNRQLIGIIVLGAKLSNDAYTEEDLELLSTLSYQAGIAVDNARLYKEIQDFNETLKQKVDEQTKDIGEKNKYLRELLNMKSDFLRVVNHQLNTPLSVLNGAFSLIKEKAIKPEKGMKIAAAGLSRINQTVSDFWDAYELEGEKMKMNPEKTDLEEIIDKLLAEKKNLKLAQDRNLRLAVEKPDFKLPLVWCDPKKIEHVVSNLLDNAVFYTPKGEVAISYELIGSKLLKVNIKDTGAGIAAKDKEKLFQKFSRGTGATNLHPDGSGLGLYIAKKIVGGNDGELIYSSEGLNQGSTFSFTLPLYQNQKISLEKQAEKKIGAREEVTIFEKNL